MALLSLSLTRILIIPGGEVIEEKGVFTPTDVHKQYGICFRTPPFYNQNITEAVLVSCQLFKPSDQVMYPNNL